MIIVKGDPKSGLISLEQNVPLHLHPRGVRFNVEEVSRLVAELIIVAVLVKSGYAYPVPDDGQSPVTKQ